MLCDVSVKPVAGKLRPAAKFADQDLRNARVGLQVAVLRQALAGHAVDERMLETAGRIVARAAPESQPACNGNDERPRYMPRSDRLSLKSY